MPRSKVNPELHDFAYDLYREGAGPKAIYEAIWERFGDEAVSERTVATWVKGFKSLSPETIALDSPFQWHLMDRYGLPWEAGQYIMDILYLIEEIREVQKARAETIPRNGRVRITPHPTARDALWCWRVHLAAPEIATTVGYLSDVYHLARQFAFREIARDVLASPVETADLEALLVYKPWLDFGGEDVRHQAYHKALDEGAVLPLSASRDTVHKAFDVVLNAATEENIDVALDTYMPVFMAAGPGHFVDHPELLESQQTALGQAKFEEWLVDHPEVMASQ